MILLYRKLENLSIIKRRPFCLRRRTHFYSGFISCQCLSTTYDSRRSQTDGIILFEAVCAEDLPFADTQTLQYRRPFLGA